MRSPIVLAVLFAVSTAAIGSPLAEPRLTIPPGGHDGPRVAVTLDACSGAADSRILKALVDNRIPATIFATARWIARNKPAMAVLMSHADLFEIEDHGARHRPAVDRPMRVFGLAAAGTPEAVKSEVIDGAAAVAAATGRAPGWFRGATARYTVSAMAEIRGLHFRLAGYSLAADQGATLSARATARRIGNARDGDVILAHVNQPRRPSGAGVVAGLLALKAKGFRFLKLDDALPERYGPLLTH